MHISLQHKGINTNFTSQTDFMPKMLVSRTQTIQTVTSYFKHIYRHRSKQNFQVPELVTNMQNKVQYSGKPKKKSNCLLELNHYNSLYASFNLCPKINKFNSPLTKVFMVNVHHSAICTRSSGIGEILRIRNLSSSPYHSFSPYVIPWPALLQQISAQIHLVPNSENG